MKPFLRQMRTEDEELKKLFLANQVSLEQFLTDDKKPERMILLGDLGEQARTLGLNDISKTYLEDALALAKEANDARRIVANMIRLGTTLQYMDEFEEAHEYLYPALEMTKDSEVQYYRDFALQHYGKFLAEKGLYEEAQQCFTAALNLRRTKGDQELIDSTEDALELMSELGMIEDGYAVTMVAPTIEPDPRAKSDEAEEE